MAQRWNRRQRPLAEKMIAMGERYALMERGLYDFPDHKPHLDSNGMPIVNKAELLRSVRIDTENGKGYAFFDENNDHWAAKLFREERQIARARIDLGVHEELSKLQPTYKDLGRGFLLELAVRFKAAPWSFPPEFLAKYGALFSRMGAEVDGELPVAGTQTHNTLVIALGELTRDLPPNVMAQVRSKLGAKLGEAGKALELVGGNGG